MIIYFVLMSCMQVKSNNEYIYNMYLGCQLEHSLSSGFENAMLVAHQLRGLSCYTFNCFPGTRSCITSVVGSAGSAPRITRRTEDDFVGGSHNVRMDKRKSSSQTNGLQAIIKRM